jgi:hypothetical protein
MSSGAGADSLAEALRDFVAGAAGRDDSGQIREVCPIRLDLAVALERLVF